MRLVSGGHQPLHRAYTFSNSQSIWSLSEDAAQSVGVSNATGEGLIGGDKQAFIFRASDGTALAVFVRRWHGCTGYDVYVTSSDSDATVLAEAYLNELDRALNTSVPGE